MPIILAHMNFSARQCQGNDAGLSVRGTGNLFLTMPIDDHGGVR